jgi:hypothetical protein
MAEVVQVIVEAFEFREQYAKRSGPNRDIAVRGALDRLAKSERVTDRSDARNPLRHDDGVTRQAAVETSLHAPMLEEEPRLIMEDVLADIEKREFRRLDDIRANGSEWQPLDILGVDDW